MFIPHILKAAASTRHGKMKMNELLTEHLGIQSVVVVIFNVSEWLVRPFEWSPVIDWVLNSLMQINTKTTI